jgi:hypothetical protein
MRGCGVKIRLRLTDGKTQEIQIEMPERPDVVIFRDRYYVFVRDDWFREAVVAFVDGQQKENFL